MFGLKTYWLKTLRYARGPRIFRTTTLGDHRFVVGSHVEFWRTVRYGGELEPLAALMFLVRPDDVVWDVGASVGLYTVHLAPRVRRVVAFEPDPATVARLRENVQVNGLTHSVDIVPAALGDRDGQVELSTSGLSGNAPAISNLGRHHASTVVPINRADTLLSTGGVAAPTVIKMDVEGAEGLVLKGAAGLLRSGSAPRLLFVEVHPQFLPRHGDVDVSQIQAGLREMSYLVIATRGRDEQFHLLAARDSAL